MSLFSITSIMIFVTSIGFALMLYLGNRTLQVNKSWLYVSIAISLWGLGLFGISFTDNREIALYAQYLLDVSAIFIPCLYLNFASHLTNIYYRFVTRIAFISALILSIFSFTPYFKVGMRELYGFFWIDPGKYYFLFPLYFAVFICFSLLILVKGYLNTEDKNTKAQLRNTLIGGAIGFSGGITNFFPQLFNVYPFGNYFILLYVFFMTYGVLRYKLMSTKIISAQIFSGGISLLFLFNLLRASDDITEIFIRFLFLLLVIFFSFFLVRGVYKEVAAKEENFKLASNLSKANAKLRALDKQKSEFLSIASHQIRGPLAAIKGYASLMLEGSFGKLTAKQREATERIFSSSHNLVLVVNDFLDVSRIDEDNMKLSLESVDWRVMIKDTIDELRPSVESKGLKISFTTDKKATYMVFADKGKLKQIISNLIDNAVKYTPNGSIAVTLEKKGAVFKMTLTDTGIGMSEETISVLFEKFSRAKDASKVNIMGTGLGLYVVKQLAVMQKGRVWAESDGVGEGSRFIVELPIHSK